tara:strand:+ start:1689 stop:3026 length:1338 start_codon:yes stop_codon:yes gene_type:complete
MTKYSVNKSSTKLVENGGSPVRLKEWLGNFTTGNEEVDAACRAIRSGYLSKFEGSFTPDPPFSFNGGPEVQKFEHLWCDYYGCNHAISLNSATSGLFASVGALGLGFGDEIIVSPYTMTAVAAAPLLYGAIPVFADVEATSGCLDPNEIEKVITNATKAIIVVHQFGFSANMEAIMKIARRYNLKVIEDCAQAHGARFKGQYVGTFGNIGVFSLNVNKTIQSGEGAVCITNDEDLSYRLKLIRNHGEAVIGPAKYKNMTNILGFNYRMTEVTAAIASEQLKKLNSLNSLRLDLVDFLKNELHQYTFLEPLSGNSCCMHCDCKSTQSCVYTYYVFPMRFKKEEINVSRNQFVSLLEQEGINFSSGYTPPLYTQPLYIKKHLFKFGYPFTAKENFGLGQDYKKGLCPIAEKLHSEEFILSEYIRPPHTISDIQDIIIALKKLLMVSK